MDAYFFRVDHELLRSPAFQELGGSAIKVYLVLGLYADFTTGWGYPSIRTIAKQAGLSRQTVLAAVGELARRGLVATSKSTGRSTAYKIIRQAPPSDRSRPTTKPAQTTTQSGPDFLEGSLNSVLDFLEVPPSSGPISSDVLAQFLDPPGPKDWPVGPIARPNQEPTTRTEDNTTIPIPGTPFLLTAEGRLQVVANVQDLLTEQGLPVRMAERLASRMKPEDIAKVLLNAHYLKSAGKLQNGPGYIRAGLEEGYELLPQVAARLEVRRRELEVAMQQKQKQQEQERVANERRSEEAAMEMVLRQLTSEQLQRLLREAVASLPEPIVRRNPTLSNPFVRNRVYELAGGDPLD
jgi:hypothetical protein